MNRAILTFITLVLIGITGSANPANTSVDVENPQIKAINNYVYFINESIDGLLLIHRLMANYNQELNKYVDLDSYQVNDFGNKDLPQDIFEDPENWFYNPSPYQWYEIAIRESSALDPDDKSKLNGLASKYKQKLEQINSVRFDLDLLTIGKDMSKKENINPVYLKLESAVALFDGLYAIQNEMQKVLIEASKKYTKTDSNSPEMKLFKDMFEAYNIARIGLINLKEKNTKTMDLILKQQYQSYDKLKSTSPASYGSPKIQSKAFASKYQSLVNATQQFNLAMTKFHQSGDVPTEHKQYGKFYYYYNINVIAKFNTYGEGITRSMNDILDYLKLDVIRGFEMPHYFKVIYPKKIKKVDKIEATDSYIEEVPRVLKERVVETSPKKMRVESSEVELLLYDHMIQDGDIVSINFNGDWILENATLETKPQRVNLKLNENGKNFIILHAENVGRRPPNTIAISYLYYGEKKELILKSDLKTSQLIEIIF